MEKKNKNILILIIVNILLLFNFCYIMSNNDKKNTVLEKNVKELEKVNKALLDSIKTINSDFEYRKFLVFEKSDIMLPKGFNPRYLYTIECYIKKYNLPERIVYRLMYKESSCDSTSYVERSGAKGLFQVTLIFWYEHRENETEYNEYNRIKIALRGLSNIYNTTGKKRWDLTLSIYNSGHYDKKNSIISQNKETKSFVKFILK